MATRGRRAGATIWDKAERESRARAGVVSAGGPIFAPAGRSFARWRVSGWSGRGDGIVTSVHIQADNRRRGRFLSIETRFDRHRDPDAFIVRQILGDAIDDDLTFPFALTIDRTNLDIPVDRTSSAALTLYRAGEAWMAVGEIGGRSLTIRSSGVLAAELSLQTIHDVAGLADSRWF